MDKFQFSTRSKVSLVSTRRLALAFVISLPQMMMGIVAWPLVVAPWLSSLQAHMHGREGVIAQREKASRALCAFRI